MPDFTLQVEPYALESSNFGLASGLRVSFQSAPDQPIVSLTAVIDRGGEVDPIGLEGTAHAVEHLWFRSHQSEQTVWDQLTAAGASRSAGRRPLTERRRGSGAGVGQPHHRHRQLHHLVPVGRQGWRGGRATPRRRLGR